MSELEKDIKKLGFGLMRLPMDGEKVDIDQTCKMVDMFLERGFTYFDTAYGYLGGLSEEAAKTALVDRHPRESFQLATKLPAWDGAKTAEEAQEMFWTSMRRTGVEYFDFFLLHNLGDERTGSFDKFGIWDFLAEQKAAGKIKHLGFSIHATADVLDTVLTAHPEMEFVQLQINYSDWEDSIIQSRKCYEVARKHGKPVIIMEPVKGGMLANPPDAVKKIFKDANPSASLPSWAIRYAASLDGVITVLSGMSTIEQMDDNTSYMVDFKPLDDSEYAVIENAQKTLKTFRQIPCTDCQYCLKGCPKDIAIPGIFRVMNYYFLSDNLKGAKGKYAWETRTRAKASECISCGQCETVCPQSIKIVDNLAEAVEVLGK